MARASELTCLPSYCIFAPARLEWIRKAKADLEAEAAAAKVVQRRQDAAEVAEQEDKASGQEQLSKRAAHRTCIAHKHADAAQKLTSRRL
jgi:hypothetical protein